MGLKVKVKIVKIPITSQAPENVVKVTGVKVKVTGQGEWF